MATQEALKQIVDDYNSGDYDRRASAIERMYHEVDGFIGHMIGKHFGAFKSQYYWDLYEEGLVAVVEYMGGFDPERGTVTTYFTPYVIHAMSAYVNQETNRSTQYYSNIMNRIREALRHFDELQVTPSVTDIAYYTGLSVKKIEDGIARINATDEKGYESEAELDSIMQKKADGPEKEMLEKERAQTLSDAIAKLDEDDRSALICYFGIDDGIQKSYSQVGKALGITSGKAMERINRALRILRSDESLRRLEGISSVRRRNTVLSKDRMSFIPNAEAPKVYSDAFPHVQPS